MSQKRSGRLPLLRSPVPLTWHLVALVTAALLPILLLSTIAISWLADYERLATEERLRGTVRTVATTVDRELKESISALEILGSSSALDMEDLPSVGDEMRRAQVVRRWLAEAVLQQDGRRVLDIVHAPGGGLHDFSGRDYVTSALRTRRPTVSGRIAGRTTGRASVAMAVPVVRSDRIKYVLVAALDASVLTHLLAHDVKADEWARLLIDRAGVIVASSREPEKYVGQAATGELSGWIAQTPEAVYQATGLDGRRVYGVFTRSQLSGWTVAASVPVETVEATLLWKRFGPFSATVFGFVALLAAFVIGRRIARPILAATRAADALARGESELVPASGVREVQGLGRALETSASLLMVREVERSRALERERDARSLAEAAAGTLARYELLASKTQDIIVFVDDDDRIVEANAAALEAYGYPHEILLTLRLQDLCDPEAWRLLPPRMADAIRNGRRFETVHRRSDGRSFPVEVSAVRTDNDGRQLVMHIIRDTSERASVARLRSDLAAIVESSDDAIIGLSSEGTITSWNVGAEKIFGYSRDEAIGESISGLTPPGRDDEETDILLQLGRGNGAYHIETVRIGKAGTPIDLSVTVSPIRTDISERRRTEEAARARTPGPRLDPERGVREPAHRGRREGHRAQRRDRPAALRGRRGPGQAQAGPVQLPLERPEVHARRGPGHRADPEPRIR